MTGTPTSDTPPAQRTRRVLAILARTPFTLGFVVLLFVVGAITGTLWSAAENQDWYTQVATGLPAFQEGRWWSLFTAVLFVPRPYVFITLLPLLVGGLGWAEWRFGSLRTIGLFLGGHIVGVLGAAGIIALLAPTGWHWADMLASAYDVGPSCGAFTALVFATATLPSPWRLRARVATAIYIGVSLLYLGHIFDVEHAVALLVAMTVSGLLPAFRRPASRPTEREWRLIAFAGLLTIGAIQLIDLLVPYDGPLGINTPEPASMIDIAIDVTVILLVAHGIRKGYRAAWIGAIVLAAFNILSVLVLLGLTALLAAFGDPDPATDLLGIVIAPGVAWLAQLGFMIAGRGAFRVPLRASRRGLTAESLSSEQTIERLQRFGGGTVSWMATWPANRHIALGEGAAAYQEHSGVAIMLGDPIVAPDQRAAALTEYATAVQRSGSIPCVFSAGRATSEARPDGWRSVVIAEDTIVDLPDLAFTGKKWNAVRTAMNRAGREGVSFRLTTLADEPWNVLAQVRAISEQWTGDKGLPEMRFTLGTVEEALDPQTRIGIAVDEGGNLHGVTSWLPVYGPADADGTPHVRGWTLDLMRRRDGGFGPVMEFLIAAAAQRFSEEGYAFVSLSGAPLVRSAEAEPSPIDQVLDQLGGLIEPLYGFKSLHRFKQKFNPRHEPLTMLYRDEGDLPRIGVALTRAYLPDASTRDLVSTAAGITSRS